MRTTTYDRNRLLFRRQFLLGPRFAGDFPGWRCVPVGSEMFLTVHPDLPVYRTYDESASIALLGYVIDPDKPLASDPEILAGLLPHLQEHSTPEGFIRRTHPFGGRWILIATNGHATWLFNDPCGYRAVYYTLGSRHGLWAASQPGLLAEVLNLAPDEDAMQFIQAYRKRKPEYWWPGDSSPYREVRHLVPNHYLDLKTGVTHRFWPVDDIPSRPTEEVAAENARLLRRLIESAAHRFELALPVTAGNDTRLLLAASKTIRDRLYCFTLQYWDLTPESPDIRVPSRLLPKLGLTHHVIRCPSRMDRKFAELYRRNTTAAHDAYGPIAQGMYDSYPQEKVSMKGCAMPVTGGWYRIRMRNEVPQAEADGIDAPLLARLARIPAQDFALDALDRWLSSASEVRVAGLDPLSLFFWEDREGNWQAMTHVEFDVAREIFVPYNCRTLLANMLSIPESDRSKPEFRLHKKMMLQLWPEVLIEPINPPANRTVVSIARGFLRKPGCMNWRWLGSQVAAKWISPAESSKDNHEGETAHSV